MGTRWCISTIITEPVSSSVGSTVHRPGVIPSVLRLLVAVGVFACLIGFGGRGDAVTTTEMAAGMPAVAMNSAAHRDHQAPAAPEHHDASGSHSHGCMAATPGTDSDLVLAPVPATVVMTPAVPSVGRAIADAVTAPRRPPSDLDVLCVWRN